MKEVKITPPEGYEIDKEKSTFEEIVFKPIENDFPKSWEKYTKKSDNNGGYFYSIYVGDISEGYLCGYEENSKLLSISYIMDSTNNPSLKFKVKDIYEATNIVQKFAEGMNHRIEKKY